MTPAVAKQPGSDNTAIRPFNANVPDAETACGGAPAPAGMSADEKAAYDRLVFVYSKDIAYG